MSVSTESTAPSDAGALIATFTPASPGHRVTLERQTRRGWQAVAPGLRKREGRRSTVSNRIRRLAV